MKQVMTILVGFLISLAAFTQSSALTITIYGNKNLQLAIDSINQSLSDGSSTDVETTIVINDLGNGPHSLQVTRVNLNTNRPDKISTPFILRNGFDLLIKVNQDNSLELIETKNSGSSDVLVPMSALNFNNLVKNVKAQVTAAGKRTVIANAFNNTNNAFTTSQARQLLTLVNNEGFRLQLAKLSYRGITDKGNFYKLYDLLFNQNSVNELADYVYNYENSNTNLAMSESDFNILQQSILQQWPVSAQMNSLVSAFNNPNHYFTSSQASQLIQLVTAESNRLQLAKLSYRSITDRGNFYQVFNLLNTQASKNELETYVNNYGGGTNAAMSESDFNALFQTIQYQSPASAQMNSITNAFNNPINFFTTSQAGRLIQLINTESNRLQLAKLSYRSITDRNNFYQIADLLSSQASKNDLQAYVNSYSGDTKPPTKVPMADAEYNNLLKSIQSKFFPFEKMNSLTELFNTTSSYFTTAQAKKLIGLVSLESNRLYLAKLSYRTISDRENFSQLYDLLSSQNSRNELDAYVKAYKE